MKYITTPIYYVNDAPHIGHAVTTLAADVLARSYALRGEEVFFLTGTDEHGAKIAAAAQAKQQTPKDFADSVSEQFESAWEALNIQPDGFIRTTHPNHQACVQRFLQDLYDKGHIYKGEYTGWYCVGCEEFKTETQIAEGNTCPIHLTPLTEVAEEAYLFKLSAFSAQLLGVIEQDKLKIQPESRKNEVLGFLKHDELKDVTISRKNVAWGIPLPWDASHTVYVWVDALLNYLSATDENGPVFKSGKRPEFPPSLQLIGKDILRFHAVIWPALLLASGKLLPEALFVHGYFTLNGQKMSKSLGNVITPQQLIDRYGVDGARYLLLAAVPFGADGDISLERLDSLYNSDLANNLGNLVNRVQAMLTKYRDGVVPEVTIDDLEIKSLLALPFGGVIEPTQAHITRLNTYIEENKPWTLAQSENAEDQARLDCVLATLAENVVAVGVRFAALLPETSVKILSIFGSSIDEIAYDTLGKTNLVSGVQIQPVEPLFPRLS